MKLLKRFLSFFGISEYNTPPDYNLLADDKLRRRFSSPRSAASQLFQILNAEKRAKFAQTILELNNEHTLVRFAMIGQELRVLAYRAATDLGDGNGILPIYDDSWDTEGTFHYLITKDTDGKSKAELQIRNSQPHLRYDAYEPDRCWIMPLTAAEIEKFQRNWLPTIGPMALA